MRIKPIFYLAKRFYSSSSDITKALSALRSEIPPEIISTSQSVRDHHSHDESHHKPHPPEAVLSPTDTSQVSRILKIANQFRVPVIPFGTGTGLEGGVVAEKPSICIDMTSMDKILSVNNEDFAVTVEPGVTRCRLNDHLHDTGLWFPVDPGADASLCGMCATSASGTNAVRYGTMKENTVNLQVVLANGEIIWTSGEGRRAKKSAAGYNLTNLFVGSEGTLGIITAATLKLYPYPETIAAAVCSFPTIQNALDAVTLVIECSIPVARIEFLDDAQMDACNKYSDLDYPVISTIFLEFHGSNTEVQNQAEAVGDIFSANQGSEFRWSHHTEDMHKLWKARHEAYYAALATRPGTKGFTTDVCVPISELGSVLVETKSDLEKNELAGYIVGHVGDGNFHVILPVDPESVEELQKAWEFSDRLVKRALSSNGTCTGEHGIGLGKKKYLDMELGSGTLDVMRTIKRSLDPNNIMNPGKVFDL